MGWCSDLPFYETKFHSLITAIHSQGDVGKLSREACGKGLSKKPAQPGSRLSFLRFLLLPKTWSLSVEDTEAKQKARHAFNT